MYWNTVCTPSWYLFYDYLEERKNDCSKEDISFLHLNIKLINKTNKNLRKIKLY